LGLFRVFFRIKGFLDEKAPAKKNKRAKKKSKTQNKTSVGGGLDIKREKKNGGRFFYL
jgi:hypothetical protein